MKPGGGRKPQLSEQERSTILYLVQLPPPSKPTYELTGELEVPDPQGEPEWTLDALTAMARKKGIQVARSQVRRIFWQEGVRWRHTRLWASSKDRDFVPKERRSSRSTPAHPGGATILCVDALRRTRPRDTTQFSSRFRLVAGRPPDQSAA